MSCDGVRFYFCARGYGVCKSKKKFAFADPGRVLWKICNNWKLVSGGVCGTRQKYHENVH